MERSWIAVGIVAAGLVALSTPVEARQRRDTPAQQWRQAARRDARLHAIATGPTTPRTTSMLPDRYTYTLPDHTKARTREAELRAMANNSSLTSAQRAAALNRANKIAAQIQTKDHARIAAIGNPLIGQRLEDQQRTLKAQVNNPALSATQRANAQARLEAVNAKIAAREVELLNRDPNPQKFPGLRGSGKVPPLHSNRDRVVEFNRTTRTSTIKPRNP